MDNIGLFAGVFDPIHLGHTEFIKRAIEENNLDKVYVLIEHEPKYKQCIASYADRKRMAELAIGNISKADIYESKSKFFPITASLPEVRNHNPDARIHLLIGDDVASHIDKWDEADELKGINLIIAERGAPLPYSDVSSLKIRQKIKSGQEPELDPAVAEYIKINNLY